MSFDRRWLLTAAGSALLASIANRARGDSTCSDPSLPADVKDGCEKAWEAFRKGFGKMTPSEESTCRAFLDATYGSRFVDTYPGLGADRRTHLVGFAQHLGELTAFCLDSERKGKCGWKQVPAAPLREEHLQRARELVGFATNKHLKGVKCSGGKRNGRGEYEVLQADEQCPLCPP